jgi:hypothetical protein
MGSGGSDDDDDPVEDVDDDWAISAISHSTRASKRYPIIILLSDVIEKWDQALVSEARIRY